jgi:hypothetical protein
MYLNRVIEEGKMVESWIESLFFAATVSMAISAYLGYFPTRFDVVV